MEKDFNKENWDNISSPVYLISVMLLVLNPGMVEIIWSYYYQIDIYEHVWPFIWSKALFLKEDTLFISLPQLLLC